MRNQLSVLRWVAMAVLMVAACKEDPTGSLLSGFTRLELEFSYREVIIGDSVLTYALERDDQGNPLPPTASISTACTGGVASVRSANAAPQLRTAFFVKGLAYGTSCVLASAGGKVDTMQIATFPLGVRVTGPDTVTSGATGTYTHTYFNALQAATTVPVAPTWGSTDTNIATISAAGVVGGFDPGVATVRATGPGSGNITTPAPACTGCVRGTKVVFVNPRPFVGTVSGAGGGADGSPGDTVILVRDPGASVFNTSVAADSARVTFNFTFVPTFVARRVADSMYIVVPPTNKVGAMDLVVGRRVPATRIAEKTNFVSPSASSADRYDPANDAPAGGFTITANGDYYVSMGGVCAPDPILGFGVGVNADCDDFITIQNTSGVTRSVTVNLRWVPSGADLDFYFCSSVCFDFSDFLGGAFTANNPEQNATPRSITAGSSIQLWINNFDSHGIARQLLRVRVSGL
jgi:hypothetical protein